MHPPDARRSDRVALDAVDRGGADGALWSLPHDGDLDANLVKLSPGAEVAAHSNTEVDVILVVLAGGGTLTIDGEAVILGPHHLVRIRKGTHRHLEAGPDGLVHLTVHRARQGLRIGPPPG